MSNETTAVHTSFTVEREYPAAPARVFAAFADPATKRLWYAEGERGWELKEFTSDFRVGGREVLHGRLPEGQEIVNNTVYQDIVTDRRIVFSAAMTYQGKCILVSLGTIEITPAGTGARLTYTDQNALLDGSEAFLGEGKPGSFKEGWRTLLERLGRHLQAAQ